MCERMLRLINVTHKYGQKTVLSDVSIDIEKGDIVCLIGASGCGKTTSLRVIAGLEMLHQGQIFIGGNCVSTEQIMLPPEKRNIGLLFQDYALFPHLTVKDNVLFGLSRRHKPNVKQHIVDLLTKTGIIGLAHQFPATLSGGEQQRVALARALATTPDLILMDEPFSSLDFALRNDMRRLVLSLLKSYQMTSLIVTHDIEDALRIGNKIAVMFDGKIIQFDSAETVYQNPINANVAKLFGHVNVMKSYRKNGVIELPIGNIISNKPNHTVNVLVKCHDILLEKGEGDYIDFEVMVLRVKKLSIDWSIELCFDDGTVWEVLTREQKIPIEGKKQKFYILLNSIMVFNV